MTSIVRATEADSPLLAELAKQTFIESHWKSSPEEDAKKYLLENFNEKTLVSELRNPDNIYHLLYHNEELVGFSKIIFNVPFEDGVDKNMTKLQRIFLLKKVYDLKLGFELLSFNLDLMKQHHQTGVWLYVWIENERAIKFYTRNGFRIVGSHDFKISENHTNPNHIMFLDFAEK